MAEKCAFVQNCILRMTRRELVAGLLLGTAGFAANYFNLSLFFNVDFLFGSVFSMFALLRYGPASGLLAALIAASCTWLQWHHPWAIVIFSAEALVAGVLLYRHRIELITAVVLFWFSVGLLLVWLFYHQVMGFSGGATLLISLKQGVNGIINTLLAEVLFLLSLRLKPTPGTLPSLRRWLQIILQGLVLVPAFVLAFADINWLFKQQMSRLQQDTARMAAVGKVMLDHLLTAEHRPDVSGHADQGKTTSDPAIQKLMRGIINQRAVSLSLLDPQRRVLATTSAERMPGQVFAFPADGRMVPVGGAVSHWIPDPKPGIGAMKRWLRSFYTTEVELAPESGLRLVVEASLAPSLQLINSRTSILLGVLALLTLLIIALSLYFSRRLLAPITELSRATSQLPLKIAQGQQIGWRPAEVSEEQGLQDNFSQMEQALQQSFRELNAINEELEQRVAQRTAELQDRERQLSYVLKATGEGIWDWYIDSGAVQHNRRWCEILQLDDALLEHPLELFAGYLHPEDRAWVLAAVQAALDGDGHYRSIHRMLTGSGEVVWVEDRGEVVERDAGGRALRMAGSINNITARKHAEAQLELKQQQLEELNRSLQQQVEQAVAELRTKDQVLISQGRQAAMGEMIGNIAHQWRQPLNALSILISNIQLARMNDELSEQYMAEAAANADRLIQKMSSTINDFRNFFHPDKAKVPFSARHQINAAVQLVEAAFKNIGVSMQVEEGPDCQLIGFPNEFSQVLLNLLGNARDAIVETGNRQGLISISLAEQAGMGVVTVQDNGGGVPDEISDKIFEPYFSTKKMGTGIGLYMSKMIIERNMQGRITVRPVEGGSAFDISAPLAGEALQPAQVLQREAQP